jgi:hypothetical protein
VKRCALTLILVFVPILASAAGPQIEVHTTDGSVYYGELVEKVDNHHVTILLATGVRKQLAWKDIDPSSVPAPPKLTVDDPRPGPTKTVRTKAGAIYHGEIVEDVPGDHVTLKLATGELRHVAQSDIDASPPPPPRTEPRALPPVENVVTKNGSVYHGEILEKVVRDHVTIRLATGDVKTIDWEDIDVSQHAPVVVAPPEVEEPVASDMLFIAIPENAELQRFNTATSTYTAFCTSPCKEAAVPDGQYRVGGDGLQPTSAFLLQRGSNRVEATMAPAGLHTAGLVLSFLAFPTLVTGFGLAIAAATASSVTSVCDGSVCNIPNNNTLIDVMAVTTNLVAGALLIGGIYLLVTATSSVTVNRHAVARVVGPDGFHF